ncbi:hypothetical protein E4U42_000983 [Claviceps africana]|uniref:Uncharacterized protein n=1 Tax=Claviceps africana TaxID=83212 RepID=A0A8K0JC59_9HYPO|nr:hypothetical protein E4U42_000983 [Claviceps africana]
MHFSASAALAALALHAGQAVAQAPANGNAPKSVPCAPLASSRSVFTDTKKSGDCMWTTSGDWKCTDAGILLLKSPQGLHVDPPNEDVLVYIRCFGDNGHVFACAAGGFSYIDDTTVCQKTAIAYVKVGIP